MATNLGRNLGTEHTIGKWTDVQEAPRAKAFSETRVQINKEAFLVQGRPAQTAGGAGIAVTVAPATLSKKLAIRKLNSEVEGWTARSDTISGKLGQ